MAICCQKLTLCALSSRSALSVLVGAPFKKFGLFLNAPRTSPSSYKLTTATDTERIVKKTFQIVTARIITQN
jgi:hypothetical protein